MRTVHVCACTCSPVTESVWVCVCSNESVGSNERFCGAGSTAVLGTLYWSAPLLGGLELDNDDYLWFSFLALCVSVSLFCQLACLSLFKNTPELHLIGKLLESLMQQFFSIPDVSLRAPVHVSVLDREAWNTLWETFSNENFDKYLSI